ncbi:UNVERIFIED_CONTAM: hypothetical protein Sangu_2784300 [Sesamum angustifolium]|uniref:Uncharacterized protein n=1 Tax=Sesamum angustifolium TaxID=2727405 RepID=A0AAW2IUG9_9LAMI
MVSAAELRRSGAGEADGGGAGLTEEQLPGPRREKRRAEHGAGDAVRQQTAPTWLLCKTGVFG